MSKESAKKIPKLRFPEFTDAWEQRKLGEIITEYKETVDSECTLPILTSSKTEGVILQEEHFGRKQQHDITGYNILPRNYCTYRNRSDGVDFTFNINKCCDKGIISKFYPVFSGKNSDVFFLSLVLNNSDEVVREIAYTCTGTGQKVLSFLDLQKMKVRVPSYDEQKEIAAYFENLDHLITLHQRKLEKLKEYKKGMLQKMFPKNGEKIPEVRFPGFTDDWEQRKFKELCTMVTVGIANSATHAYSDSGVVMFRNQNIKPNFLDDTDIVHINSEFEAKYKNKRLKKNDLLIARTGYPGTTCVVPEKYENSQTFTTLIARPNKNVNPYFLCQYLNSDIGIKYFESTQIGGGQKNSGAGILNEMPVTLPSAVEEEKRIADYFIQLDNFITLHQRKIDSLKEFKKGCLQQMFV